MSTDTCDFCKRDIGLKVFINRYIFSKTYGTISLDKSEIQKELYNVDFEKADINSYLFSQKNVGMSSNIFDQSLENNSDLIDESSKDESLSKVKPNLHFKILGSLAQYSYPIHRTNSSHEQYGFSGSVLRQGFLYIYLKHLNKWEEYQVSELGFLKRINENNYDELSPLISLASTEKKQEPCTNIKHRANALTITIPKPNEATIVYFKYSEHAWSKQTKARNKAANFYEKYMDKFDVKKFIAGQYQKGAFPMQQGISKFCVDTDTFIANPKDHIGKLNITTLKNKRIENNISKELFRHSDYLSYLSGKSIEQILKDKEGSSSSAVKIELLSNTLFSRQ